MITTNRTDTYDIVCGMEDNLGTIDDILTAFDAMADSIHEDFPCIASSLMRLVNLAKRECAAAEDARGKLFHLTHPSNTKQEKSA